ncbi:MAG: dTMP kinase [Gammaproteobacteria bacterium]|nr:dTMP kinase [Gammaproteobacteria bacterium]
MQTDTPTGIFLTIEGIEGVGKTTAMKFIQKYLTHIHQDFVLTREPGGTGVAEQIRQILLTPNTIETITPEAELLLMFASRAQHIQHFILPHLREGKVVVSDRFVDASYAYQGGGRQIDINRIATLEKWIMDNLRPHATILLDAPAALGMARAKNRGSQDRIEQEKIDFFERVRAAYLVRAENDKQRFYVLDATQPLNVVHAQIKTVLDKLFGMTR